MVQWFVQVCRSEPCEAEQERLHALALGLGSTATGITARG